MKPQVQFFKSDIPAVPGPNGQARTRAGELLAADIPINPGSGQTGDMSKPGKHRPGLARRVARAVDRLVTRVQGWFESKDSCLALVAGYGICGLAVVYLIIRMVIR